MKKIYYLSTCTTCKRILSELPNLESFELQEIKKNPVTANELQEMYSKTGSYEKLFNKRAQLYKARGLKDQNLQEEDFKALIEEHYTFLNSSSKDCPSLARNNFMLFIASSITF